MIPLVPAAELPRPAPAGLRERVPAGYGVQEQCLPFTAATALGLLVPAPFDFGLCPEAELPTGVRRFRAPAAADSTATGRPGKDRDTRWFYVRDRPQCRFTGNAFQLDALPFADPNGQRQDMRPVQPGLSFFERGDQQALFKLHLPFVLRTTDQVDSLFIAPINRPAPVALVSGLVETDWYAHPVNLVCQRPVHGSLHVSAGTVIAQVVLVPRALRKATAVVCTAGSPAQRAAQDDLLRWFVAHGRDRSAYRRLARSRLGRLDSNGAPAEHG